MEEARRVAVAQEQESTLQQDINYFFNNLQMNSSWLLVSQFSTLFGNVQVADDKEIITFEGKP